MKTVIRTAAILLPGLIAGAEIAAAQSRCNIRLAEPIYRKFDESRTSDTTTAAMLAREYLKVCSDTSMMMTRRTQAYLAALEMNALTGDRGARRAELSDLIHVEKKFAEAYELGGRLVAEDSTDLEVLTNLGYAGFLAVQANQRAFDTLAIRYSRLALERIEAGTVRREWTPFTSRDETMAWLHFTLGTLLYETTPAEAARHLYRASTFPTALRTEPTLYYIMASAYENGVYQPLHKDYVATYGGKPVTKESQAAKAQIDTVMDRIMEIYAHALMHEKPDAPERKAALERVESYYKARYGADATGMAALLEKAKTTPLTPIGN